MEGFGKFWKVLKGLEGFGHDLFLQPSRYHHKNQRKICCTDYCRTSYITSLGPELCSKNYFGFSVRFGSVRFGSVPCGSGSGSVRFLFWFLRFGSIRFRFPVSGSVWNFHVIVTTDGT